MNKRSGRFENKAFTLVELLVVIAIIALLVSILLPSLAKAREQAKKMKCLGNMKDIGSASHTYSSEDPADVLVPTPRRKGVTPGDGFIWFWGNDTFGGKGGNPDFVRGDAGWKWVWTAAQAFGPGDRPLNRLLFKDFSILSYEAADANDDTYVPDDPRIHAHTKIDLQVFHCPSDVGLQQGKGILNPNILGSGFAYAPGHADVEPETPFYDITGNSYTTHWATPLWPTPGDGVPFYGAGAIQRPLNRIPTPARCIIYREGNGAQVEDYNTLSGGDNAASQNYRMDGWHGEDMIFNATFADGHASIISHLVRTNVVDIDSQAYELEYEDDFSLRGSRIERVAGPGPLYPQWNDSLIYVRGDGWQLDFLPQPMVIVYEAGAGDL